MHSLKVAASYFGLAFGTGFVLGSIRVPFLGSSRRCPPSLAGRRPVGRPPIMKGLEPFIALRAIKILHTLVWALFAGCIVAMPIASAFGNHRLAAWLGAAVCFEIAVLLG